MAVEHRWGDPGTPNSPAEAQWKAEHLVRIRVAGIVLWVHRELEVIFTTLCATLAAAGHVDLASSADDWGWANRNIRDGKLKSFHATGQAVDLNATTNPMGKRATSFPVEMVRRLCERLGLRWGYFYLHRPDAMHFEFIGAIEDARRITAALLTKPQRIKTAARTVARVFRRNPFPEPTRLLVPGDRGRDVMWVQFELGSKTDGVYGPITYRAVLALQKRAGLTGRNLDGKVGPITRSLWSLWRA